jgi:hypothetical protein
MTQALGGPRQRPRSCQPREAAEAGMPQDHTTTARAPGTIIGRDKVKDESFSEIWIAVAAIAAIGITVAAVMLGAA